MIQNETIVNNTYRKFTSEELDNIWSNRFQSQEKLASYHKTSRTQIKRILKRLKQEREATQLSKEEIVQIAKSTPNVKTEIVTKLVETKMEAIAIEAKYKSAQIETQNTIHVALTQDIEKSRTIVDKSTNIAMRSLQSAIDQLDHSDSFSVTAIATAYEKIVNAQQKHMNTLMNVGSRYGIVDQTPKTPLVDQSTHNHNQNNSMVMMNLPAPLTDDDIAKMNDSVYNARVVE